MKTIGVSEHRFKLNTGNMVSHDWRVFDVGGARSLVSHVVFPREIVEIDFAPERLDIILFSIKGLTVVLLQLLGHRISTIWMLLSIWLLCPDSTK